MGKSFEQLKISRSLLKTLGQIGFLEPTPIQERAIPLIRSGANVVGVAQTGTGKTAAYLLPLIMKLVKAEGDDPRVIILVPTRELSIQVGEDVEELLGNSNLRCAAVFGGIGITKHIQLFENGIDILVATPGRLWDLYKAGAFGVKKLKNLVIDEADRMLDMGFMPQLRQLFEVIPPKRQNLLFSATFSEMVEEMAIEFLDHFEKIEVDPSATPAALIDQKYYKVGNYRTKLNLIKHLLEDEEVFSRVIIFAKTKENAEGVFKVIKRKAEGEKRILHSNKGQTARINAIQGFKDGEIRILISTDVSARGLDASLVSHVINFDLPLRYEDYIHRIGRTARAGNKGTAITLIDASEEWHMKKIENLMGAKILEIKFPKEIEIVKSEFDESQKQLREIDRQKKIDDPEYKGAFHEKKKKSKSKREYVDHFKKKMRQPKQSKRR